MVLNMRIVVILLCVMVICDATKCKHKYGVKATKLQNGFEYSNISRGNLLKLLTNFEKNIQKQYHKQPVKPIYTAHYSNNKFTNPFIYPQVFNVKKSQPASHKND